MNSHFDLVGIGIGPFNLGLAALLEKTHLSARFFDKNLEFNWHKGMLFDDSTLQVPFLADLVTLADPMSPYSFLNYLHEQQRLFPFYFWERFQPLRREYNAYCRWVAKKLSDCHFGWEVKEVLFEGGFFHLIRECARTGAKEKSSSSHLVVGVGTTPSVPEGLKACLGERVFHSAQTLSKKDALEPLERVCVVGSGQSAAECVLYLLKDSKKRVTWLTRSDGFFPMEYSKLGLEHFTPSYTQAFFSLPMAEKKKTLKKQGLLYKGISAATIADIFDELYLRTVDGESQPLELLSRVEVQTIEEERRVLFRHLQKEERGRVDVEAVILATGYEQAPLSCLEPLENLLERNEQGELVVDSTYNVASASSPGKIFVQNAEKHTHGVGAPDLGLGPFRNATIINTLLGKEFYKVAHKTAFQCFDIPHHLKNYKY